MGVYDIPLESIIILVSLILVYLSYKFYKNLDESLNKSGKLFFISFIMLFISSILDLLDEFYGEFIIDIGGEIGLIITFIFFIISLFMFNKVGDKEGKKNVRN